LFAPKDLLKFVLLYLASRGPVTGTEVLRWVQANTLEQWRPSPGSVYPLLRRLQEKGLVRGLQQGKGRAYIATRAGLLELAKESEPPRVRRQLTLLSLYLRLLGPAYQDLAGLLERKAEELKAQK